MSDPTLKQPNPLQHEIDAVNRMKDAVNRAAAEHPDVKAGKCTVEDQLKEPSFLLYNKISESVVQILSQPEVTSAFVQIGKKLGDDISKNLVTIVGMCMATSAHNAILFYDDLLKEELTKKFGQFAEAIATCETDNLTFHRVLEVFKKRLDNLEKEKKIREAAKEAGIDPNAVT